VLYGVFQTTRSEYDIGIRNLMVVVEGALAVTVIVWYVRGAEQLRGLIVAYAAGAVLPSLIGIYQVYGVLLTNSIPPLPLTGWLGPWLVPYDPDMYGGIHLHVIEGLVFPRVASTLVDANFFGIYIASVVLCVLGRTVGLLLASHRRTVPIVLHTVAIAVGLVVLLFTMSRSAWIGFAAGALYLAYHATKLHAETARIRIAMALVVSACAVLIWQVLVLTGLDLPILAMSRAQDLSSGLITRYDFASGALEAFSTNPVFGVGRANLISFTGYPTAHSYYLTRLGEDGLVGLGLALMWLLVIWRSGARLVARNVDPGIRWAATGLRSALLALLAANIPYDHLMATEVNWVLLGLAAAMGRVTAPIHQPAAAPPGPSSTDTA
jgi:O-antigen ligase